MKDNRSNANPVSDVDLESLRRLDTALRIAATLQGVIEAANVRESEARERIAALEAQLFKLSMAAKASIARQGGGATGTAGQQNIRGQRGGTETKREDTVYALIDALAQVEELEATPAVLKQCQKDLARARAILAATAERLAETESSLFQRNAALEQAQYRLSAVDNEYQQVIASLRAEIDHLAARDADGEPKARLRTTNSRHGRTIRRFILHAKYTLLALCLRGFAWFLGRFTTPSKRSAASAARARGDQMRDEGRWQDAAIHYQTYLTTYSGDSDLWIQLGNMHKESQFYDAAIKAYRRASSLRPLHAEPHIQSAEAMRRQGKLSNAAASFMRAYELDPRSRAAQEIRAPEIMQHLS